MRRVPYFILALLCWPCLVLANSALKLELAVDKELVQPPTTASIFSKVSWLQQQQLASSEVYSNSAELPAQQQQLLLRYQNVPRWRANWRGGLRWQAQDNLLFRAKGNRISSHLTLSNKLFCAICKTHIDTTLWKDGHVQFKLKSYFE
ncbi:hypothetical protein [Agarivorans gilvus]|uniref:Uncharacterized protein n=1 Tax=Agarivorans gilvus TaxID=680279 RepID=A0ABQ1I4Z5_9ALTE|nr:hypothetical protein [Agarivorans gilvus]GGB12858.1 hypothetical protein GCM10007414_27740 [Agarivorans gilvus]